MLRNAYEISLLAIALSLDALCSMGTAGVFVSAASSLFHRAAAKASLLHGTAGLSGRTSVFLIRADLTGLDHLFNLGGLDLGNVLKVDTKG